MNSVFHLVLLCSHVLGSTCVKLLHYKPPFSLPRHLCVCTHKPMSVCPPVCGLCSSPPPHTSDRRSLPAWHPSGRCLSRCGAGGLGVFGFVWENASDRPESPTSRARTCARCQPDFFRTTSMLPAWCSTAGCGTRATCVAGVVSDRPLALLMKGVSPRSL